MSMLDKDTLRSHFWVLLFSLIYTTLTIIMVFQSYVFDEDLLVDI